MRGRGEAVWLKRPLMPRPPIRIPIGQTTLVCARRPRVRLSAATFAILIPGIAITSASMAQNPHDPYANWWPSGKLTIGDAKSEALYEYKRDGAKEEFTIHPRGTRFGALDVNLVLIIERPAPAETPIAVTIDGKDGGGGNIGAGETVLVYAAPRSLTHVDNGQAIRDKIRMALTTSPDYASRPATIRFYMTRDWVILGEDYEGVQPAPAAQPGAGIGLAEQVSARDYIEGLLHEFHGDTGGARRSYKQAINQAGFQSPIPELASRRIRHCELVEQGRRLRGHEPMAHFRIGMLCMESGSFEEAVEQLRLATEQDPNNAEAWYLYADALGYAYGEQGEQIANAIPYFEKAAASSGREPNVWDVYVGIYTKMLLDETDSEGKPTGRRTLKEMSPENVEKIKRNWDWMSTILWAASRGSFKLKNNYVIVDKEVYVNDDDYFKTLWTPGDYDVFVKFYEGGPAETCGVDCGPNHTAIIDIGTWCDWEVYLHEFNHTIDWAMVTSEVGRGVPVTHASDWCGWQPIPTMGCGHRSLNHYYMTPGMFEVIQGGDHPTSPFIQEWLVAGPFSSHGREGLDIAYLRPEGRVPVRDTEKATGQWKVHVSSGPWVDLSDLSSTLSGRTGRPMESVVAYAHCYVSVPSTQKVRMWLGMNDAARVWVNGILVHKGVYAAICNWDEANELDQLACAVTLREGWNSVLVKVENYPKTPEQLAAAHVEKNGWGFSLRFTDLKGRAVDGMETRMLRPPGWDYPRTAPPTEPTYYNWWQVRDDYTNKIPLLSETDLKRFTKLPTLEITSDVVIHVSRKGREPAVEMGAPVRYYFDRNDTVLDNEMNWPRENVAVVRYPVYTKASKSSPEVREWHDLVFLRPEAYDLYLSLMRVPEEARTKHGIKSHADRVIGYVLVDREDSPNGRVLLVVDTYLGEQLPVFEWDLLDLDRVRSG
jgi:tetratricopeptide (TPR) repeat protein